MNATVKKTSLVLSTSILMSCCASKTLIESNPNEGKITDSCMKEVLKKQWTYILFECDGNYTLSVICGTVALYTIQVQLNEEEVKKYKTNGVGYIDELAKKIQSEPDNFKDR